jgi:hypothetical protein
MISEEEFRERFQHLPPQELLHALYRLSVSFERVMLARGSVSTRSPQLREEALERASRAAAKESFDGSDRTENPGERVLRAHGLGPENT